MGRFIDLEYLFLVLQALTEQARLYARCDNWQGVLDNLTFATATGNDPELLLQAQALCAYGEIPSSLVKIAVVVVDNAQIEACCWTQCLLFAGLF